MLSKVTTGVMVVAMAVAASTTAADADWRGRGGYYRPAPVYRHYEPRYGGCGWGCGAAVGLGAAAIAGGLLAAPYAYRPPVVMAPPVYVLPPPPPPVYYAPAPYYPNW